jgi:hypothetical protein
VTSTQVRAGGARCLFPGSVHFGACAQSGALPFAVRFAGSTASSGLLFAGRSRCSLGSGPVLTFRSRREPRRTSSLLDGPPGSQSGALSSAS